jgi:hypothetical protein
MRGQGLPIRFPDWLALLGSGRGLLVDGVEYHKENM